MIKQLFLNIALLIWTIPGFLVAIILTKVFQTLKLGPVNGHFYSFLVLLLWITPGIIISWRPVKKTVQP